MNRFSAARFGAWLLVTIAALSGLGCDPVRNSEAEAVSDPTAKAESDPRLPGVASVDETLQQRLDRALASQGPSYTPRTHHLADDGSPRFTNRLIEESSPYLLQHAHNPVNWYAWSDEAFERAKRENKPGLSSGRLLDLPLVPRDGTRVVRGRGDRGISQRVTSSRSK